jgi:hypothetical protein
LVEVGAALHIESVDTMVCYASNGLISGSRVISTAEAVSESETAFVGETTAAKLLAAAKSDEEWNQTLPLYLTQPPAKRKIGMRSEQRRKLIQIFDCESVRRSKK